MEPPSLESRQHIPQELVDYIFGYLHEDISTLRTCSIVSHSFLFSALPHIYHQIILVHSLEVNRFWKYHPGRLYQCDKFSNLLLANPVIARSVRTLGIYSDTHGLELLCRSPSLPSILISLSNLTRIGMVNRHSVSDWMRFPENLRSALLSVFQSPALTTLHLDGVENVPDSDAQRILDRGSSSSLRHLSLKWVNVPLRPPMRQSQEKLPVLESLTLAGDKGNLILNHLMLPNTFFDMRPIRKLSIQVSEAYPRLPDIENALDELKESLEHLIFDVSTVDYRGEYVFLVSNPGLIFS
ncbi:uncharacterized protein EV420DRAFT_833319 [Desarmillaria tabescens]|uniref:F-box domain-containing protein n=1 Tax=Armillaria tabescens TaxID=1929756 RepID=A0AA39JYH3_ARMTA|nr:uncharacterized protein EV420DRAFT_833319 [Desarmillaria tabescens]KAK0448918.1 hypothetical protein EV420DRAFT_833319 [Desarmillaria tabescens]